MGYLACGSWGGHRTWGDTTCGVHSFISLVTQACLAFYPFKYSYKFIFNSVGGVPLDGFISVLTKKVIGFTDVVLSIHYNHCHPLSAVNTMWSLSLLSSLIAAF